MKLCMIGCRGHCGYVFESIQETPEVELCGISSGSEDPVEDLRRRAAEAGFDPVVYDDYRHMLDEIKPDIVCIDGPFEKHAQMCILAVDRHINVFCEKPIALTLDDLAKVEAAYRNSSVQLISMVATRYSPHFYTAHALVNAGTIGKCKLIQAQKSYKIGLRPGFYKHRVTYGGSIGWVGSHAIDWIQWFGGSDFDSVFATQSRANNFGNGDLEITAQCQFTFRSGLMAQVSIDYLRPGGASTHGDDRIRLAGTQGVLEVSGGKVTLLDADGAREIPLPAAERRIFSDFVLSVQGKRRCLTNAEETFALTRACLKAQQAADEERIVRF